MRMSMCMQTKLSAPACARLRPGAGTPQQRASVKHGLGPAQAAQVRNRKVGAAKENLFKRCEHRQWAGQLNMLQ